MVSQTEDSNIDPIGAYLKLAADHCKPLTAEQEREAFEAGDLEALINSQLLWVINLARRVGRQRNFTDIESLIAAANLALVRSVRSFDPDKGRLTTYVSRPVLWECYDVVNEQLGPSAGQIQRNPKLRPPMLWGDEPPVGELDPKSDPVLEAIKSERLERTHKALAGFPEKHAEVMRKRYLEEKTLKETGDELGISKERVRQIQANVKHHLRKELAEI